MTFMCHHCIFICFIYVMCILTRPSFLINLALIFEFLKYPSHQESNDECILLAEIKHSQPHTTLYHSSVCCNCGVNSKQNVESLIIIISSSSLVSLRLPSFG